MLVALLALLACQEPFGTDPHDLEGFRIAALSVRLEGHALVPAPAIVVDGRPWSDEPVGLRWFALDHPDALAGDELPEPLATRPAPELPPVDLLGLVATAPDGTERRAFLELEEVVDVAPPTLGWQALPLHARDVDASQLELDARLGLEPVDGSPEPGSFLRLTLSPEVSRSRWMATWGTFFELDGSTADWVAARLELDDEQIVRRELFGPGFVTILGLALDGTPAWTAIDVPVGEFGTGAWAGGRFLPSDAPVEGAVMATLLADDDSPTGLRLTDVEPMDPDTDWGTEALPCAAPVSGPFDPRWLFEARCTRAQVVGARVGLRVDP